MAIINNVYLLQRGDQPQSPINNLLSNEATMQEYTYQVWKYSNMAKINEVSTPIRVATCFPDQLNSNWILKWGSAGSAKVLRDSPANSGRDKGSSKQIAESEWAEGEDWAKGMSQSNQSVYQNKNKNSMTRRGYF